MTKPEHEKTMSMRIPFEQLRAALACCLRGRGFAEERAARCAFLIAENDLVGVSSHGVNRLARFVESVDRGWVDPQASPKRISVHGSIERWDGRLGAGPLNAETCMKRAIHIARRAGMGCVALRNTNHWMRAGAYAWHAAEQGFPALCATNTEPNLPPWGSQDAKLGNNPLAMAVPRENAQHVLFDGAMSQFSYGTLERAARHRERLSIPGGYDTAGNLTDNPAEILRSRRALPIGYWKGSGLSFLLDLLITLLSAGQSTRELGQQEAEYAVSQIFIAFDRSMIDAEVLSGIEESIADLHSASALGDKPVTYPGERLYRRRQHNLEHGVPVEEGIWEEIAKGPNAYREA